MYHFSHWFANHSVMIEKTIHNEFLIAMLVSVLPTQNDSFLMSNKSFLNYKKCNHPAMTGASL